MNELVRQAARMQRKIDQVKGELKDREVRRIDVDPAFLASEGLEMALDAIVAASNSALETADKLVESEIAKVTGGVKLPGMHT